MHLARRQKTPADVVRRCAGQAGARYRRRRCAGWQRVCRRFFPDVRSRPRKHRDAYRLRRALPPAAVLLRRADAAESARWCARCGSRLRRFARRRAWPRRPVARAHNAGSPPARQISVRRDTARAAHPQQDSAHCARAHQRPAHRRRYRPFQCGWRASAHCAPRRPIPARGCRLRAAWGNRA